MAFFNTNHDFYATQKTYSVTVVSKVTITTFSYSNTNIDKGKTSSSPTVSITGTAKSGPTYSSSNTGVATVNSSGVVTGVAAGTATITVSYTNYDGSITTKTCSITIKASVTTTIVNGFSPGNCLLYVGNSSKDSSGTDSRYAIKFDKSISKLANVRYGSTLANMPLTTTDEYGIWLKDNQISNWFETKAGYYSCDVYFTDGTNCNITYYHASGTTGTISQITIQ